MRYRKLWPICDNSITAQIRRDRVNGVTIGVDGMAGVLGSSQTLRQHHSRSKSSSLKEGQMALSVSPTPENSAHTSSLYLATVRLSLEVSTQVTKSSMCLL